MGVIDSGLATEFGSLILGLGISFALSILFTVIVKGNLRTFIMFFVVWVAVCTWASLFEVWVLVLAIVGGLIAIWLEYKSNTYTISLG